MYKCLYFVDKGSDVDDQLLCKLHAGVCEALKHVWRNQDSSDKRDFEKQNSGRIVIDIIDRC